MRLVFSRTDVKEARFTGAGGCDLQTETPRIQNLECLPKNGESEPSKRSVYGARSAALLTFPQIDTSNPRNHQEITVNVRNHHGRQQDSHSVKISRGDS